MNGLRTGAMALFGITALAGLALAEAESGFGIYGGYANHSSKGQFTEAPFDGQEFEFSSQGLSYGIDYQFALGDSFSISPFLMSSQEQFEEESNFFSSLGIDVGAGHCERFESANGVRGLVAEQNPGQGVANRNCADPA